MERSLRVFRLIKRLFRVLRALAKTLAEKTVR
jgi:hypothetical protein